MNSKLIIWPLIYGMVAAGIFYVCYVEKQRSLLLSLLALCFVLLMGFLVSKAQQWIEVGKLRGFNRFAAISFLVNVTFFTVEVIFFSDGVWGFLLSAIIFTAVYGVISWMRSRRG